MTDNEFTPARKKQFVAGGIMMLLVIVLALFVAARGEGIYMALQGYTQTCSPVADGEGGILRAGCSYCKCAEGRLAPGVGGSPMCSDGAKPICERIE